MMNRETILLADSAMPNIKIGFNLNGKKLMFEEFDDFSLRDVIFKISLINGVPMYCRFDPSVGKHLFINKGWEIEFSARFIEVIKSIKEKNFIFIDAGMHFGYFSLLVSILCPDCTIIGFEPDPDNLKIAFLNLFFHKNKRLNLCALSDKNGEAEFYYGITESARGSLFKDQLYLEEKMHKDIVTTCRWDYFGIDYSKVKAVKVDIQGAERLVLKDIYDSVCSGTHLFVEDSPEAIEVMSKMSFSHQELIYPNWHLIKG